MFLQYLLQQYTCELLQGIFEIFLLAGLREAESKLVRLQEGEHRQLHPDVLGIKYKISEIFVGEVSCV
jgi:hypothetical protein